MTSHGDSVFLTARKLYTLLSQPHLAVAPCGQLSLGRRELRPVSVLMDAFSSELDTQTPLAGNVRIPSAMFAAQLGEYLAAVWHSYMLPEDDDTLDLIVAGYDAGMSYGEFYSLQVPGSLQPGPHRPANQPFFAAFWGHTFGVHGLVEPYSFPVDIMPLPDVTSLAAHLITSTAQLEAWATMRQRVAVPVQVVTITQSGGVSWITPDQPE